MQHISYAGVCDGVCFVGGVIFEVLNNIMSNNESVGKQYFSYAVDKPLAYVTVEIKTEVIHALIAKYRMEERKSVSFGDIILHALAQGFKSYPEFNSHYFDKLELFSSVNVGYFINLGKGAKVAVIEKADEKSIVEISTEVKNLAMKYLHNELLDSDVLKGTFTVTNLSMFDVVQVNSPVLQHQSCMISLAKERDAVEVVEGLVVPIRIFNLTLSFDSRVADCQKAVQFLSFVKKILESK